jgi:hypothetical protein
MNNITKVLYIDDKLWLHITLQTKNLYGYVIKSMDDYLPN